VELAEQALYRKYRSADFGQLVGQEHVVQTLTNALKSGRVSHAYLFTGPRGVGKTSVARLLARALNCSGEGDRPCNKCTNCQASLDSSLDIIEIDAASNRRIEEVRDIRDKINLAPTMGKYKVYIIDEVHMLTTEAFNALLKTLEEPPAHAVFILATTEAHKLPATIISRTQRFNFRALSPDEIRAHLKAIAAAEKIPADDEAIGLIAQAARGGFRDAISLLDQLGAAGHDKIEAIHVRTMLGWSDATALENLARTMADRDAAGALGQLDQLISSGAQPGQIVTQLTELWRGLLYASVNAGTSSLDLKLEPHFAAMVVEKLVEIAKSPWPGLSLEAAIVAVASDAPAPAVSQTAKPAASNAQAKASGTASAPARPASNGSFDELWPKALLAVKSQNNSLYALLRSCKVELDGEKVKLLTRFNFHRDRIMESKNRQIVEAALSKTYGKTYQVVAQLDNEAAGRRAAQPSPTTELVSQAIDILGGEVVD
jgi:DNA polymerase-3 subunit gamma/tau